jgi:hypothetical protein
MSFLSSNWVAGLPALFGVVLGLRLYVSEPVLVFYLVVLFVVAFVVRNIGNNVMLRSPTVGRALIECWIVSAIIVTAFATAGIAWITFSGPLDFIISTKQLVPDQVKTMSTALIGAATTYVALVWTKDIGDAKGYFWPSTHFKKAMQCAYKAMSTKPNGDSQLYDALFLDDVREYGDLGWDFAARGIRVQILANYLHNPS